jgi:hypothetical protein
VSHLARDGNLEKVSERGLRKLPYLRDWKPHLATISFASECVSIPAVARKLTKEEWYVSRIAEPPGIHQVANFAHEPIVDDRLYRRALTKIQQSGARIERRVGCDVLEIGRFYGVTIV